MIFIFLESYKHNQKWNNRQDRQIEFVQKHNVFKYFKGHKDSERFKYELACFQDISATLSKKRLR
jgi:hypothetical protein